MSWEPGGQTDKIAILIERWGAILTGLSATIAAVWITLRKVFGPIIDRKRAAAAVEKRSAMEWQIHRTQQLEQEVEELRQQRDQLYERLVASTATNAALNQILRSLDVHQAEPTSEQSAPNPGTEKNPQSSTWNESMPLPPPPKMPKR